LAIRTVNKMLASELAVLDDDHLSSSPDNFHFQCPAKSCGSVFDADVPYSTFVAHVGNHAAELFIPGGFRKCYFGCHEDFIDELQRRAHTKFCPPYHKLPHASKVPTPCPAEGCKYFGKKNGQHWGFAHGLAGSRSVVDASGGNTESRAI
jgi:hypothetical protein